MFSYSFNLISDFAIRATAPWRLKFIWKDENEDPIPNTNYEAFFQIRKANAENSLVIALDQDDGITLGGSNGEVLIEIDESDTDLEIGVYNYTLELKDTNGRVYPLMTGLVEVVYRGIDDNDS
jgi:hypothetical protein